MKQNTVPQNRTIPDKIRPQKILLFILVGLLVSTFLLMKDHAENLSSIFERSPALSQFEVEGTLVHGEFLPGLQNQHESLQEGDREFVMLQISAVIPLGGIAFLLQHILLGSLLVGVVALQILDFRKYSLS